ncbi:MAG: iron-containing redox enzyme family protein [Methyloceanibacter sp.]|uniref:iron-containing redox enzyme family protein n=1 Tax=Methyloceanibacter sp. TaxID=1965321 RepID=UPI003EE00288
MTPTDLSWTEHADALDGSDFVRFHTELAKYNGAQIEPGFPSRTWREELEGLARAMRAEGEYVEAARAAVEPLLSDIPTDVDGFIAWFEDLRETGPGQGDPLFPWLAEEATRDDMLWFLTQEVAGEAGFDDLLAMTQVKMPIAAKLEMARNYWDEMGRGRESAMHGPLLERLVDFLDIDARPERVVPESLALGNAMLAMARSRRYCFQSVGALGVIEMTAPTRAGFVADGLKRLRVPTKKRLYFTLHAVLDIKHSECWNREVLRPLVAEDPSRAVAIGEGALLRLWHGARCFERYRRHFGFDNRRSEAA